MNKITDEIAGLLLAAGTSSRFGEQNKLLVEISGKPIVQHAAESLVAAGVDPIVAVVGHEADAVSMALQETEIEIVENSAFRTGQASSVRVGIAAIDDRSEAVVIGLGDMPKVTVDTIHTLCRAYHAGKGNALAAAFDGQRGNPVLFGKQWFHALRTVEGDVGGRSILRAHGSLVETGDPGVITDVDHPDDLTNFEAGQWSIHGIDERRRP